jgi:hypothetical protein
MEQLHCGVNALTHTGHTVRREMERRQGLEPIVRAALGLMVWPSSPSGWVHRLYVCSSIVNRRFCFVTEEKMKESTSNNSIHDIP